MLKKLLRGLVVSMAIVGAYATIRFLLWPRPAVVFEDENWVVLRSAGQARRCVVIERDGAPIPDFPLETNSDSGAWVERTDASGRGTFVSFGGPGATAWLPTGHQLPLHDMGFTVIVRKRP
ncbi:MAG: hypothetical protein H6835_17505 [Planctomycetes bacterium]|nr:hypothetical protein [Planctomycetota bacterium]